MTSKLTFKKRLASSVVALSMALGPQAASAEEGVTFGVLVPLTGELGEFGKIVANGVQLAVNQINDEGGTSCGPIRTVVADTGGNPETGIREASKMIESESAVAILGPTSGVMVALADLAKRTETMLMSPYAGTITLNELGGDFVFRTVASDLGDGAVSGLWLEERGYKSVAFLIQNEESTISPAEIAKSAVEDAGIELTDYIVYNPGQPSYQAELISVLAHNPDAIYLAGGQNSSVTVIKEATAGGFEGEWLFTADLAVPEVFDLIGAELLNDRAFVEQADSDPSLPEYQAYSELHQSKTDGEDPGPFSANSYDMANLVALAMEASGECTGAGINSKIRDVAHEGDVVTTFAEGRAALQQGAEINYEGASGPVAFDETGTVTSPYTVSAAKDGVWVLEKFYPASTFIE